MYSIICKNMYFYLVIIQESHALRLLTVGSAMFGKTIILVTRVRLPISFGTLKDGSLTIKSLQLNNCFSDRNCKMASKLYQKWFKKPNFCQMMVKIWYIWFQFLKHVVQIHIKYCMERLKTSSVSICKTSSKDF